MQLTPSISDGSVSKAHKATVAVRPRLPSFAGSRWNKVGRDTVEEVDDRKRQASMNEETLRARFESQMLPLMGEAYNLARWLMKNDQEAQDAVQEAYLRAFRYFEGFHGESGKAWLLKIVRNVCLSYFSDSREGKVVSIDDADLQVEDLAPLPSVVLERKVTIDAVRATVEALPSDFRAVIVLREMDGLSYKEIAEVTGVPIGTVMSRLARARQHLSTLLKEKKELGQL
jgi:RNA polymerase sigma-70 factor (ECF subfamily)